jgi:hypothetical protein
LIEDRQQEQDEALVVLRERLRGVIGELKQLLPDGDRRWKRFGFNLPAEPETPAQPVHVQVDNAAPGKLLVTCATVAFTERYRCYAANVGTALEPAPVGSSNEPLFVVESLEAGGHDSPRAPFRTMLSERQPEATQAGRASRLSANADDLPSGSVNEF